jgi:sterol desaturase/sphingolipid hydroxylase (fatty acid hydroxylase superfamily)/poly(3-hydroxybutyrate) depolymerase
MPDPIAFAIPFFFLLIGGELLLAKRRGVALYRLTDTLTDLSCGITSQVVLIFWAATQLAIYAWVYKHAHLVNLSPSWGAPWLPWVVAFFGVDFLYYSWHRLSHEVNVLWAAHVVHHTSEDYNLAVALRQSVLTSWTALPFYLPLALLGVPPLVFAVVHALSTLYQFWIHTQLVRKLRGPVDWILNLPSHHRVHHAINPEYLDKNYGATLVVWDRLFGTYAEEIAPPVYGTTKPLASFDPLWAQVHYWLDIRSMMRAASGAPEKLRVLFASPAWKPRAYVADSPPIQGRTKYDRPVSRKLATYVLVQYVLVVVATTALLTWHHGLPHSVVVMSALAVVGGLVAVGALLEGRPWAVRAEVGRLALGSLAVALLLSSGACRRDRRPITITKLEGEGTVLPSRAPLGADVVTSSTRTSMRSIDVDGTRRRYLLVEPTKLDASKRYPVILVMHGDGGDASGFHEGYPFERATGAEAILAYPDGLGFTWDLETLIENRDVKLAEAIFDELAARFPVDRSRLFATGYSSGGFLANVIACQRSGLLRAIASNAGGAPYKQAQTWPNGYSKCPGQAPIAMLALHGEDDYGVSLSSGRFSAEYWAYVNGCKTDEMETTGYRECHVYRGCPSGKAVGYCPIPGLGHWVWERAAVATWSFFLTQ